MTPAALQSSRHQSATGSPLCRKCLQATARIKDHTCFTWAHGPATKTSACCSNAFSRSGLAADYRLLAVGGGAWAEDEQARIASLGLSGSVSLIPKAEDAVLARAYRDAALFVYPSLYEGFGFPPLEAMSLGCPVLVNRTSSLPEVCGDAAFYFEASDAGGARACLLVSTLEDAEGLAIKRRLGEQQVRLYDWGRSARKTLDVYRAVMSR